MFRRLVSGIKTITLVAVFGFALCGPAAGEEPPHHNHAHGTAGYELGVSAGRVSLDEGEEAFGVHVHLLKRLGAEGVKRHFAAGLSTEIIFGDHKHYAAMFSLAAHPWRGLTLSIAPGIEWAEHDGERESNYATHLEAIYVIEVGEFDIGPAVAYSTTGEEEHHTIGVHLGLHW